MKKLALVLTCEHAGNQIPTTFQYLFNDASADLNAHTGWDPGALQLTEALAEAFQVDYHAYHYTRLLIEMNRSEKHPQLYSKFSQKLMSQDKNYLLRTYYQPYRKKIEGVIRDFIEEGHLVVHVSVHTFTPVLDGQTREVEVGLLFDDLRAGETAFSKSWKQEVEKIDPQLVVRYNEPYLGSDDGFTTFLRTLFTDEDYLGLELEVNQKFVDGDFDHITQMVCQSLQNCFEAREKSSSSIQSSLKDV